MHDTTDGPVWWDEPGQDFCPSVCNDGGRVEVDVPVVQVVDVGAVQLLDEVAVSWRQSGKGRRLDAFSWG